ncbi:serine/threonine protein kinase, putative [Trichophyton benhamiae CBS 112371]|uniref:Serine/threonine protein kinase, putative n=1 Tax=Arthroderma benhamiae (strain ATCC MYA-4681 / CBS 112371) TaxID=663331 RepID=D4AKE1_ARTBC|nr:serine/threonine protein kinase, putative [Trichophyton benhamiae CBS 112371]EFE36445.1 serine/threonine protein kinase, putative [Trichophyton benhamiae CBS 112371]
MLARSCWDSTSNPGYQCKKGDANKPFIEWKLFANEEFIVGRNSSSCHLVVDDPVVSNVHLRIYSIIFDQENPTQVAPLVYVQDLSRNGAFWNGLKIGKASGGFLLSDGDMVKVCRSVVIEYRGERVLQTPFDQVQIQEMKQFEEQYTITNRTLGCGAYGRVHMSIDKKKKRQLACKIVNLAHLKARLRQIEMGKMPQTTVSEARNKASKQRRLTYRVQAKLGMYDREVEILQKLRHVSEASTSGQFATAANKTASPTSSISKKSSRHTMPSGDLFSFLEFKNGKLLDVEAAVIIRQVVIALVYLHGQNIVHRDIKPDNVLMTSLSNGSRVILTDFGCARYLNPKKSRMASVMGTLEYTAPEMGQGCHKPTKGYTKSVDLWSLGCLTVVLLTGGSPFSDPVTGKYCGKLAKQCNLDVLEQDEDWKCIGDRAKQFVRGLLVLDDKQRMTAEQALDHDWFTNSAHSQAFNELYVRAIQGWEPRDEKEQVLYDLRYAQGSMGEYTFWQGRSAIQLSPEGQEHDRKSTSPEDEIGESSYFSISRWDPEMKAGRNISITLSDPGNKEAPERLHSSTDASSPHSPQGSTGQKRDGILMDPKRAIVRFEATSHDDAADHQAKPRIRNPFSPEAWNKNDHEPVQRPKGTQSNTSVGDDMGHEQPETATEGEWDPNVVRSTAAPSLITKKHRNEVLGLRPERAAAQHVPAKRNFKGASSRPKCDSNGNRSSLEEDEVFEEVLDPLTGKRRVVRYGEQ